MPSAAFGPVLKTDCGVHDVIRVDGYIQKDDDGVFTDKEVIDLTLAFFAWLEEYGGLGLAFGGIIGVVQDSEERDRATRLGLAPQLP